MTENWSRRIPFKVDIAGIIEIMGASLYSRADTPIRELIQNAHDAIMRRKRSDLNYQGRIDIRQDAENATLSFEDDGVGLSPDDAETFLGTLGLGITGLIKTGRAPEAIPNGSGDSGDLIGQFGIGLFSGFMLAERMEVVSRRLDCEQAVSWSAGQGTEIELAHAQREETGTRVTLHLKAEYQFLVETPEVIEQAVREFADFLPVPIFLNDGTQRLNVINAPWFDATPDRETMELELESAFQETPLDVIPIRVEKPVSIAGALCISPQRVPGFSDAATVMVTVRRMIISRQIRDLLPPWASFLRGVLELHDCSPTASREDLVRNTAFKQVALTIEQRLFAHFEDLAENEPQRLEAAINWHRYTFAGAALEDPRLRDLLRRVYRVPTSKGRLTFDEILDQSRADALFENDADFVVWYNSDRRQEGWMNQLFTGRDVPCVHTCRSFEETLLALIVADNNARGEATDLRIASPGSPNFSESILGLKDIEDARAEWQQFLDNTGARILVASSNARTPVLAFLNERYELARSFDELRKDGDIPSGFQRLIDNHFRGDAPDRNEVVLNRSHPMVARVLSQRSGTPLASVLRLLVQNALSSAGASADESARQQQMSDLDWIAEALWGKTDE